MRSSKIKSVVGSIEIKLFQTKLAKSALYFRPR